MQVIIIEDEKPVSEALSKMLHFIDSEIEVMAVCTSVKDSIEVLQKSTVDLVFMDIELKDGNSFSVLEALENINFQIIFITAYNQYAVKAFKFSAIDYLLKPFDPDELKVAITKAKEILEKEKNYQIAIENLKENWAEPKTLVIKTAGEYHVIPIEEIVRLNADGAYTHVYFNDKKVLCSKNLKHYENMMESHHFFRCHQSHLINLKYVSTVSFDSVLLKNNTEVPISRRKRKGLNDALMNN